MDPTITLICAAVLLWIGLGRSPSSDPSSTATDC